MQAPTTTDFELITQDAVKAAVPASRVTGTPSDHDRSGCARSVPATAHDEPTGPHKSQRGDRAKAAHDVE